MSELKGGTWERRQMGRAESLQEGELQQMVNKTIIIFHYSHTGHIDTY